MKARRIPVNQHFAIDVIADCNPSAVATDTDAVWDSESVLDENSLVLYLNRRAEGDTMCGDCVPVVVADQQTVAVRAAQFIGSNRPGG
jgi:hypothetical protein